VISTFIPPRARKRRCVRRTCIVVFYIVMDGTRVRR
jgi:hypothetical protein